MIGAARSAHESKLSVQRWEETDPGDLRASISVILVFILKLACNPLPELYLYIRPLSQSSDVVPC